MTGLLFIFGLAIFLLAMKNLEQGIREASGEGLKNWIVGKTDTALGSAASGVVVTGILQSSSMVSLLVLAFVSAGIMPLFNGIGVVLGANLGTTFTGWVATIVGFKMDLEALVVPMLGVGAILNFSYFRNPKLSGIGRTLFAFGLLVYGLDVMKTSVESISHILNVSILKGMPVWVYFIVGVLLAAIMQSSSAVMIISLSLLNSNLLELASAAAIVVGADLGTTSTTILGSLGESIVKKQLAFAQVFFNLFTNVLALVFMLPILPYMLSFFSITDTMFGLVTFHSEFNLLGLIMFLPILKYYTHWVENVLPIPQDKRIHFFDVPVEVPDVALNSLSDSVDCLAVDAIGINVGELQLPAIRKPASLAKTQSPLPGSFETKYELLKALKARIVKYASRMQMAELSEEQSVRVARLVSATRDIVYACKTLKDVRVDYEKLSLSDVFDCNLLKSHKEYLSSVFAQITTLCVGQHEPAFVTEQFEFLTEANARHFEESNVLVTDLSKSEDAVMADLSTWFNLNHELHHCVRYWLSAILERNQLN